MYERYYKLKYVKEKMDDSGKKDSESAIGDKKDSSYEEFFGGDDEEEQHDIETS